MASRYSAYRHGSDTVPPDVVDRILVGACAAVWLVLIGVSVAAAVALADLGQGFHKTARNSHTTWVLYVVIVVSALIIAGAIPVLLRARRSAQAEPPARLVGASTRVGGTPPEGGTPTRLRGTAEQPVRTGHATARTVAERARPGRIRASAAAAESSGTTVDRIWLRGTVALTGTMGVALIAVAAATYLMAVGHDGASWFAYGLAGIVTVAMPAMEWLHVRQLRQVVAAH
jgi:Protein of unknown function (DUF2561)